MNTSKLKRFFLTLGILAVTLLLAIAVFHALGAKFRRFAGRFFRPYLALENITGKALADQSLLLLSREELAQKIAAIQEKNRELAFRAANVDALREENQRLRRLGQLKSAPEWLAIPAEIVLRDPLFWKNCLTVNRGSAAGVRRGDAVVDVLDDGQVIFVGVVHAVDPESAEIYTVFHPQLRFSFRLKESGGIGFVNATDRQAEPGAVAVEYLTALPFFEHEEMFTTGFERQIPPGLKIGKLLSVNTSDPLYFAEKRHNGSALPAIHADTLQFVLILSRRERIFCPVCHRVQPEKSAYCPQCGTELTHEGNAQ